ncbi:hypothetical protein UFOVP35_38 [uncultured Caudovirales phage]|uniref:Uncharacterized protein n=1 Tax=uncultured Caudovirales phage TaxID=2100421 RepID=A0A6J5KMX2_9CAUD|nr:hypothetical protein UFOVP35_38 [uncultured Caudovirales phage]CAB4124406.1 hypothetical protein UFOVP52_9 [uncultured Caudovirales phage]CAB5219827.1 hypothetical protein UFOVP234_34 [uncultured Caudovirales phage]
MVPKPSPLSSSADINLYGQDPSSVEAYQKALQDSVTALEQRYAQPNWFNVAAGFLKPQLGGFAASLGSATQALGENVEKQREAQPQIAMMRAELGRSQMAMGNQKQAADALSQWQASGKPMDEGTYARIIALAPGSSAANAAKAAYEGEKTNVGLQTAKQQLSVSQQAQELQRAQQELNAGVITREEYQNRLKGLQQFAPTAEKVPSRPSDTSNTTLVPSKELTPSPTGTPTFKFDLGTNYENLPGILKNIKGMPAEDQKGAMDYVESLLSPGVPLSRTVEKKEEKGPVTLSSGLGATSGMTPEQNAAAIKRAEDSAETRYQGLQSVGAPETYTPLSRAVQNQIELIKNNKEAAGRVSAVLAGSPLLAALNEGVGVSLNGLSANLRLPVETYIRAKLDPKDQDLGKAMANNYATIALAQQKIGNVNPSSARNMELGLYKGATPSLDTTPNVSLRALSHLKQDLDSTHEQFNHTKSILMGENKDIKLAKDEPARLSAILNHSTFDNILTPYNKKHQAIEDAFQRSLKRP